MAASWTLIEQARPSSGTSTSSRHTSNISPSVTLRAESTKTTVASNMKVVQFKTCSYNFSLTIATIVLNCNLSIYWTSKEHITGLSLSEVDTEHLLISLKLHVIDYVNVSTLCVIILCIKRWECDVERLLYKVLSKYCTKQQQQHET